MVVDMHAHVVVPGVGAEVSWSESGQVVAFESRQVRSAVREFSDLGRILEEQDRAGVDHLVLSPWVQLLGHEPERQNEALAGLVSDRVSCLGTVAIDRPDELLELMRDGRLSGVEVAASTGGEYLGSRRYRPFWAAAEETGALVFVHPTTRALDMEVFAQHYLSNTLGNPLETTITAAHMVLEGVLDDHPNLKVVLAHGGGAVTALRGRLQHHQDLRPEGRDVLAGLRRFFYDTVVFDPGVLRALVDFVGAERVVLGSDYPFDMGEDQPAEVVRTLELPAADEERILSGNALSLLGQVPGR